MTHALEWIEQHGRYLRTIGAAKLRKLIGRQKQECTWCGIAVKPPKRCWCSTECINAFWERTNVGRQRDVVQERYQGRCGLCDRLCDASRRYTRQKHWALRRASYVDGQLAKWMFCPWVGTLGRRERQQFINRRGRKNLRKLERSNLILAWVSRNTCDWQADHIVPVVEGGGLCDITGLRLLCDDCHKQETKALAARRAQRRKDAKQTQPDSPHRTFRHNQNPGRGVKIQRGGKSDDRNDVLPGGTLGEPAGKVGSSNRRARASKKRLK